MWARSPANRMRSSGSESLVRRAAAPPGSQVAARLRSPRRPPARPPRTGSVVVALSSHCPLPFASKDLRIPILRDRNVQGKRWVRSNPDVLPAIWVVPSGKLRRAITGFGTGEFHQRRRGELSVATLLAGLQPTGLHHPARKTLLRPSPYPDRALPFAKFNSRVCGRTGSAAAALA